VGGGLVAAVLVLLAAGAVVVTHPAGPPPPGGGTSTGALVKDSIAACPDPGPSAGSSSRVDAGSVPVPGLGSGGSVRQGPSGTPGKPLSLPRGHLVKVPSPSGKPPVVTAHGDIAAGLFGFRADHGAGASTVAVAPCAAPRPVWWFTGAGAALDHTSRLVMTNVDPGPAVVDVSVYGPNGPISTLATRGIIIGPGRQQTLNLTDIAPQTSDMAIGIHASRGRLVAAMADRFAASPAASPGEDWIPPQATPSRVVRLAGMPAHAAKRDLLISNPSSLQALVSIQIVGKNGTFAPSGLGDLQVPPGTVLKTDVSKALGSEPSSLRLESRVPITASLRSTEGTDASYAGAVQPLEGPAAAPVVPGSTSTLVLSAGSIAGEATVAAYDSQGHQVSSTSLTIKAKTTVTWKPKKKAAYVVVTPRGGHGHGSVYGAMTFGGGGLSEVPLETLPVREQTPVVEPGIH
jgi:hypothetical protein